MIRENQKNFNCIQIFLDSFIFLIALACAFFLRFLDYSDSYIPVDFYLRISIIALPIYLLIYNFFQLYESYRSKRLLLEIERVFKANIAGIIFIFVLSFMLKEVNISRMVILLFALLNTIFMTCSRVALRKVLRSMRKNGLNIKRMLIVGDNDLALAFSRKIISNPNLGYLIIGFLDNPLAHSHSGPLLHHLSYKGRFDDIEKVIEQDTVDEVMIALDYDQYPVLPALIEACEKSGAKLSIIPFYTKYLPAKPHIDEIEGLPVINIRKIPLDNLLYHSIKRVFDFFASFVLILILSPLLLVAAIAVKASSPGPILYKQERVGLNKKNFMMYKFRSMRVATDGSDKTAWSTKGDPRKTKFGAFIRKYSIDELPQLFNVLEGTMSLVGPRPEIPYHVYNFKEEIPLYMVKHQVRPGITGWAQVNGLRGDTSIKARIEHDIFYIENWSFFFDLRILIMTVFKGVVSHSE